MRPANIPSTPEAQIREWLNPYLLGWEEPTQAEIDRFAQLGAILAGVNSESSWGDVSNVGPAISQLLHSGALGRRWRVRDQLNSFYDSYMQIAKLLEKEALRLPEAEAISGIRLAHLLLRRSKDSTSSLLQFLVDVSYEMYLARAIAGVAKRTQSLATLDQLGELIPSVSRHDEVLERAIRGDVHYGLIPCLADPYAELEPIGGLYSALNPNLFDPTIPEEPLWCGSYDPRATVELVNPILLSVLANCSKTPTTLDRSQLIVASNIFLKLPKLPKMRTGPLGQMNMARLKRKMDRIPNSAGLAVCNFFYIFDQLMVNSWMSRSLNELLRTVIALRKFQLKHGRLPRVLAELDLATAPHDFLGEGQIKWNEERRVVYSVGRDRSDGGGSITSDANPADLDFGFHLP